MPRHHAVHPPPRKNTADVRYVGEESERTGDCYKAIVCMNCCNSGEKRLFIFLRVLTLYCFSPVKRSNDRQLSVKKLVQSAQKDINNSGNGNGAVYGSKNSAVSTASSNSTSSSYQPGDTTSRVANSPFVNQNNRNASTHQKKTGGSAITPGKYATVGGTNSQSSQTSYVAPHTAPVPKKHNLSSSKDSDSSSANSVSSRKVTYGGAGGNSAVTYASAGNANKMYGGNKPNNFKTFPGPGGPKTLPKAESSGAGGKRGKFCSRCGYGVEELPTFVKVCPACNKKI